jgi:hypothetical protein
LQARVLSRQDQPNGTGAGVNFAANYLFSFHVVGTFAQRLDPVTMTLTGDRRKVADTPAAGFLGTGIAPFSASARRLALRVNPKYQRGLAWSDREGRQVVDPDGPELNETNVERIRISPDGRSLAAYRDSSIVQLDLLSGAERFIGGELIGSGKLEGNPVWSPNGELFAYDSIAPDIYNLNLYIKSPGADDARRLLSLPEDQNPTDWLDDGHGNQFLLYERSDQYTGRDLLVLPLDGKQTPILIAGTKARETNGRFSPNGKWIAYQSNEEGERNEIYVQPFPGTTNLRRKISGNGGSNPKWSRDGNELYFLSPDNHLMVVAVTFSPNGESITTVTPAPLFSSTLPEGAEFEPHPDGRRFLINAPAEGLPPVSPILVLSDWMSILSNTPVSATSQPTPTRDKGLSSQ